MDVLFAAIVVIGPVWAISAAIASAIAEDRGHKAEGIILGLLFGPFAIIAALMMSKRLRCPECRFLLPTGARRCGHCGLSFYQSVKR